MGLEVGIALAVVGYAGNVTSTLQAANAEQSALNLMAKQKTVEYQQKVLRTNDVIKRTADAQIAAATSRGYKLSSPTFNAMQLDVINQGASALEDITTEQEVMKANIAAERENISNTMYSRLFGDTINLAAGINSALYYKTLRGLNTSGSTGGSSGGTTTTH